MDSRPDSRRSIMVAVAATCASAAMLFFGTGLHPVPWLTWLAPLPLLLLAPRVSARAVALAAFSAWLAGELNTWTFLTEEIRMPVALAAGLFIAFAALFAAGVLLFRSLLLRGRTFAATLVLPTLWVTLEYVFATTSPDGAFWSLAYNQADVLPVLQVASVTGYLGITFLLLLVPSGVAALFATQVTSGQRVRLAAVTTSVLALAVGYGVVALTQTAPAGPSHRVALLSAGPVTGRLDVATPEGQAALTAYLTESRRAIAGGARTVVLPEAVFKTDPTTMGQLTAPFAGLARETGATIVVGVGVIAPELGEINDKPGGYNTAQIFPGTSEVTSYRKQHLIVTEPYEPGSSLVFVPGSGGSVAVAICKDLDFPALTRDYRRAGAQLLLIPGRDFGIDAWLHSRMAVVRGVENGMPIARSARAGALTVSDAHGRILAEARTDAAAPFVSTSAEVTVAARSTVYTLIGPGFAWLCVAGFLVTVARLRRRRAPAAPAPVAPERAAARVPSGRCTEERPVTRDRRTAGTGCPG